MTKQILPDIFAANLTIVFCGTAVGAASARRGAYYAGPGNAFWKTLYDVGLTPRRFEPEEYRQMPELGFGFTDLAKTVSGSDNVLAGRDFDREGLREKILRFAPRIVAFTSKRAAREFLGRQVDYGLLAECIGESRLFVLTSPSGAARRYWSVAPWRELARLVGDIGATGQCHI